MTDHTAKPEDRELFVIEHPQHGKRISDAWSLARKGDGWKKSQTSVEDFRADRAKKAADKQKAADASKAETKAAKKPADK